MLRCRLLFALLFCPLSLLQAAELKVLVLDGDAMPWAEVRNNQLVAGLYFDLGQALAAQMGRKARFVLLPRKRLVHSIESGGSDVLCNYLPAWLPGKFDWSTPFIPNAELLISDQRASKPASLDGFANVRIGTVLGYVYAELDRVLGERFLRDDAPSMRNNLRKMMVGRVQHMVTNQFELEYLQRQGLFKMPLHPFTILRSFKGQCAVSRSGQVRVAEVDRAIAALQAQYTLRKILERYR
ncbi:substrate-binding periplasmic protein [Iodobacter ciconiae]|nr:transporter substrate-binding domain-containing protein [Iodobacter ciconiae]